MWEAVRDMGPDPRSVRAHGAVRAPDEGAHTMGDKSPKQSSTKKPAGKSIKEKRLEKKAKARPPPRRWTT